MADYGLTHTHKQKYIKLSDIHAYYLLAAVMKIMVLFCQRRALTKIPLTTVGAWRSENVVKNEKMWAKIIKQKHR